MSGTRSILMAMTLLALVRAGAALDWQNDVRACVQAHDLGCAHRIVEKQLRTSPQDTDARAWNARLLAWDGRWDEAERQYRALLVADRGNVDVLLGLADVLMWKKDFPGALAVLDEAAAKSVSSPEILMRRANALAALQRTSDAEQAYRAVLRITPNDETARRKLRALQERPEEARHRLQIGSDIDTFSFAGVAHAESVTLDSRWNDRWSTSFMTRFARRFGSSAQTANASVTYHLTPRNWITAGGGAGSSQPVLPRAESLLEFGHGFALRASPIHGIESTVQQRNLWFHDAQVSIFATTQVFYLPKNWTWTIGFAAARTRFPGKPAAWGPAGFTRIALPVTRRLGANLLYAVGTEDFSAADQIGRLAARTFGGGCRVQLTRRQDLSAYIAIQERSQGRRQASTGVTYGIRF